VAGTSSGTERYLDSFCCFTWRLAYKILQITYLKEIPNLLQTKQSIAMKRTPARKVLPSFLVKKIYGQKYQAKIHNRRQEIIKKETFAQTNS
jgi:hypothetical protein